VHGANRLGGNGVANSTVFGAVAGDAMARWIEGQGWREPDPAAIDAAVEACEKPFRKSTPSAIHPIRERLYDVMWEQVGIIRDGAGLAQAQRELAGLEAELESCGMADGNRAFNLTWHDWLNLKSLVSVSRAIADAALARTDSRGAHYRSDFPLTGPLEQWAFTSIRDGRLTMKPVRFTRVRPGESLLKDAA
jgi:fumarate reductase flavoprotein subunit